MKIKELCLRERNRFLANLVFHQEATTKSTVHYVLLSLLYSIVLCSKKKRKENFPRFTCLHYSDNDTESPVVKPKPLIRNNENKDRFRLVKIDNIDNDDDDDDNDDDDDDDNNNNY